MPINLHCFATQGLLDQALADQVQTALQSGLDQHGHATLCVSGGRTPAGFFRALGSRALDWSRLTITLADERCVGEDSPHSNASSVRHHLLQGNAAAARFVPLHLPGETWAENRARLHDLPACFDAVVLGMGEDGHTASIFPDSPQREAALFDASDNPALAVTGKGPVAARITLTATRLLATRALFVHITGAAKWQVLGRALVAPDPALPVSHFLHSEKVEPHVFWAP